MRNVVRLRDELLLLAKLGSALQVLGWDQEVNLPPKAHWMRGEVSSVLAADLHRRFTDPKFIALVKELNEPKNFDKLSADEQIIVKETWRDVEKAQKLPIKFVAEFTRLTSEAFQAWADARKKSDFKIFKPFLTKIIEMSRQQADYLGYKGSPYNALLDQYEPEITVNKIDSLFIPLAKELETLIAKNKMNNQQALPQKTYPISDQQKLNEQVSRDFGYDLEAGRIDTSPHPFTTSFHPTDVRITTRYDADNFWVSLGSVIHEVGHALYEQGLPTKYFGTPLGESASLGIHESQSRIWENFVGRSEAFVGYLHPLLEKHFGKLNYGQRDLYLWLNRIEPSLIRVEADEVTYNLHIVLRYEIERSLLDNTIKVDDLPAIWNEKMKYYFGLDVPNDALGVLQDIHWSHGTLGYFPTYTLGNLYAAQLFITMKQSIPGLEKKIAEGNFKEFLSWLREQIHSQGRRYQPEELIKRATGKNLDPKCLVEHLRAKVELAKSL